MRIHILQENDHDQNIKCKNTDYYEYMWYTTKRDWWKELHFNLDYDYKKTMFTGYMC